MATYDPESFTRPLDVEPDVRCDGCSSFDPEGFAVPLTEGGRRAWVPLWGGPCQRCNRQC